MYFERAALNSFAEPVSSNDLQVDSMGYEMFRGTMCAPSK